MSQSTRIGGLALLMLLGLISSGCDRTVAPEPSSAETSVVPQDESLAGSAFASTSQERSGDVIQSPSGPLKQEMGADGLAAAPGKVVTGASPSLEASDVELVNRLPEVDERLVTVSPVRSDDPARMIQHLQEIDRAISDLLLASRQMEEKAFESAALRLSNMKLDAAQHLAQLSTASPEQASAGTKAQLVALSHLSGLKDVQAAKRLEEFAEGLLQHPSAELRHQGQIVLFGFEIQNLQNGVLSDANTIVQSAKQLVDDPNFRSRLEMTSISHAINVLLQLSYMDEAKAIEGLTFDAFADAPDRELRYEAWNQLTRQSRSVENFLSSLQVPEGSQLDASAVLAAARGMYQEFPNAVTLEMIAGVIPNVEYSGNLGLSSELTAFVDSELDQFAGGVSKSAIDATLAEHRQRMNWIGRKLELSGLTDADGKTFDLADYQGKVVLVDFWATWCAPCLQEMPVLKQTYQDLSEKGFSIISINMDKDAGSLQRYLQTHRFPWRTYRADNGDTKSLTDQFGITLFPHTMLMDKHGSIVSLHVRGKDLESQVRRLLQETGTE